MSPPRLPSPADERFMRLAILEAGKGLGRTAPNPAVGAVVVAAGQVVAVGHHAFAGAPHAEPVALAAAGGAARGADLYVTLEPCDHQGRTPPCSLAVLRAGVRRVFCGSRDPNPLVDGRGVARLRAAGIEVIEGVLLDACDALNLEWLRGMSAAAQGVGRAPPPAPAPRVGWHAS
ncbi:MAG: bifunctional diaminohydroxyphosphoribosylaminopyrimidine deaminase/5-amino-6-(5-phosphoribosylamino)uracil reductase RibD [Anaeromyxobacter sp.]